MIENKTTIIEITENEIIYLALSKISENILKPLAQATVYYFILILWAGSKSPSGGFRGYSQ
jgi:multisubunit Na+/H+ antiporter MnhB subunit